VSFTPSQVGARSGTLTVIDTASATPQTIPLSGNGIAATGSISLNPTTLAYGTQIKGSSSAVQYVTLTNQGNNSVNFTGAATTGDYAITYDDCAPFPYTLTAGSAGCQVGVTFTPTVTTNPDNGTLTISTSAGPQTVVLTGGGEAATLSGNVWPSAVNFGTLGTSCFPPEAHG
jgi:hypothetical protein